MGIFHGGICIVSHQANIMKVVSPHSFKAVMNRLI